MRKLAEYSIEIKNGFPPPKGKTHYRDKLPNGALAQAARRITAGQYVDNLSAGSMGKLADFIKEERRGLRTVRRIGQGDSRGTLYVVTEEWLANNPE